MLPGLAMEVIGHRVRTVTGSRMLQPALVYADTDWLVDIRKHDSSKASISTCR
jgi:hypothetical protein